MRVEGGQQQPSRGSEGEDDRERQDGSREPPSPQEIYNHFFIGSVRGVPEAVLVALAAQCEELVAIMLVKMATTISSSGNGKATASGKPCDRPDRNRVADPATLVCRRCELRERKIERKIQPRIASPRSEARPGPADNPVPCRLPLSQALEWKMLDSVAIERTRLTPPSNDDDAAAGVAALSSSIGEWILRLNAIEHACTASAFASRSTRIAITREPAG